MAEKSRNLLKRILVFVFDIDDLSKWLQKSNWLALTELEALFIQQPKFFTYHFCPEIISHKAVHPFISIIFHTLLCLPLRVTQQWSNLHFWKTMLFFKIVLYLAFLNTQTSAFDGLNVIVNLNGLGVDHVIIVGDSDDNINIQNMIQEFQDFGVPWAMMTFQQLVADQASLMKTLIVIFEEQKKDWSSSVMAENQFLILTDLQPDASEVAMKKMVMDKITRLGMDKHLRYDSQVYVGFTDYLSSMRLYEVWSCWSKAL